MTRSQKSPVVFGAMKSNAFQIHPANALSTRSPSSGSESCSPADDDVAAAISCGSGHPMLRVDRLYSDLAGPPVELAVSHFLPEQYTYRVTLRRSS